jgi:predicted nicotinamide N-methyase
MNRVKTILVLCAGVSLCACAAAGDNRKRVWTQEGGTQQQLSADAYQCNLAAQRRAPLLQMADAQNQAAKQYDACMESKGWTLQGYQ